MSDQDTFYAELAQQYRDKFQLRYGRPVNLTDTEITDIIDNDDTENEDTDTVDRSILVQMKDAEAPEETTGINSVHVIESLAINMARKAANNAVFMQHVKEALEAPEVMKRASTVMLWDMRNIFCTKREDGQWDWSEIDKLPIPGSMRKRDRLMLDDMDLGPLGNRLHDKYLVPTTEVGKDGKPKNETRSFYKTFAKHLPHGEEIQDKLDSLVLANKPETRQQAMVEHRTMSSTKRDAEGYRLRERKSRLPKLAGQAIACRFQWRDIEEELPKVAVGFNFLEFDDVGQGIEDFTEVAKPYWISAKANTNKNDILSATEFLRLNIQVAKDNGGTYDALSATLARAPKKPSTGIKEIDSPEMLTTYWAVEAAFMDQRHSDWRKRETAIIAALRADPHAIRSFGNVQMATDGVWKVIQPLYDALIQEDIRAEANERKEKAKKLAERHNEQVKPVQDNKLADLMK